MSIAAIQQTPCGRGGWATMAATSIPTERAVAGRGSGGGVDGRQFMDR
jgi:hypothetical protein